MESLGATRRKLRIEKELPLRTVAAHLIINQAILGKIERGQCKLAGFFKIKETDLLVFWLVDKLVCEIADEGVALKALNVEEEKVEYKALLKVDRKKLLNRLIKGIRQFPKIRKA